MTLNAQEIISVKSTILGESNLSILGTSNVRDFECLYEGDFQVDTLSHFLTIENEIIRVKGDSLKLKIDTFDCGKRGINRDFRGSLQSDEFPTIDISLLNFSPSDELLEEAKVLIYLAGAQKKYVLEFISTYQDNGVVKIEGEQKLAMTDFNIDPPTTFFGLIKVQDELTIKFTLLFKTL